MIETIRRGWRTRPWLLGMWAVLGVVLVAPLVAMQLTDEVAWTPFDFGFASLLLAGAGLIYELLARSSLKVRHKAVVGVGLLLTILVIWAEGAVGIFS